MLWKLLTLAVARRCALTGVGPTGTPYARSFVVRVHTFQNRRTPYGDTSVVRVHTSGSSPRLARRRAETNRIKSLRPPTHRDRRHRDRHRRMLDDDPSPRSRIRDSNHLPASSSSTRNASINQVTSSACMRESKRHLLRSSPTLKKK